MRKIKQNVLSAGVGALNGVYAILKCFPVQDKIVFISRQSDEPSIDYLMLEEQIKTRFPSFQTVMLTKTMSGASYAFHMLRQMYHLATAKAVFLDSYCIAVSVLRHRPSLQVIQLWHAMGSMKKFGYAVLGEEDGNDPDVARIMKMHHGYDRILISSKDFIKDYEEGFRMDPAIVEEIPLPKADLLADASYRNERRQALEEKYPVLREKKNILYCPTFRRHPGEDILEKISALMDAVDYEHYNLLYKPHPVSKLELHDTRFLQIPEDPFDLFFVSDYVITDYSSIIYEAGLAEIPVFLYAYDWDAYRKQRSLNIDLKNDSPMLFTDDPQKIIKAIETDDFDREAFDSFIRRNIRMPEHGTCCDAILDLLHL